MCIDLVRYEGHWYEIAMLPDSGNTKLRVSFFRPYYGDFWVLALPDDCPWVLVGEPSRKFGGLLVRTPQIAAADLAVVMALAETLGYDPTAVRLTPQTQPLP